MLFLMWIFSFLCFSGSEATASSKIDRKLSWRPLSVKNSTCKACDIQTHVSICFYLVLDKLQESYQLDDKQLWKETFWILTPF